MEPSPLGGAMIDAWLERYSDLAAPPLAQCSYARRATANPCNNPSAVRVGLRAPQRSPGPQYMPRSASPVGLARRVLRPQNNSTPDCYFYDPVVIDGCAIVRSRHRETPPFAVFRDCVTCAACRGPVFCSAPGPL